jgi:hypothetical protein
MSKQKFWIQWALISAIGWSIGLALAALVAHITAPLFKRSVILMLSDPYSEPWQDAMLNVMLDNIGDGIPGGFIGVPAAFLCGALLFILPGAVFGGVSGFMQSIALKHHIMKSHHWILASMLAWASIWGSFAGWGWAWGWGTIGKEHELFAAISIGIIQWFVLRQQVSRAYWWIVITVISWLMIRFFEPSLYVATVHGLLTGYPLAWLLKLGRD